MHGIGKTSVLEKLREKGYETIEEGFLEMVKYSVEDNTVIDGVLYMTKWLKNVLQKSYEGHALVFSDRSMWSTMVYRNWIKEEFRDEFSKLLSKIHEELYFHGIIIKTIYIYDDKETVMNRIISRKCVETDRKCIELDIKHYESIDGEYKNPYYKWDIMICRAGMDIDFLAEEVVKVSKFEIYD